jgi:hypothetical protein
MSEYQHDEFLAIDRPLTVEEMADLRAISSRAQITPFSFTTEYHWGDLEGMVDVGLLFSEGANNKLVCRLK